MSPGAGFHLVLSLLVAGILFWGVRVLPREGMQILASLPRRRRPDGTWDAVNLTWYGVMQALAMVVGLGVTVVLARSMDVPPWFLALHLVMLLAIALPAARWVAGWVEQRQGTFTVGGAVFVGTLASVPVGWLLDTPLGTEHTLPTLAAAAIGYPLGEGLGRLSCISFGCCYGKRLQDCGPTLRAVFEPFAMVPVGKIRKAVYAGRCEGEPLVPTQALSAIVLSGIALVGVGLFLEGYPRLAAGLTLSLAHLFRFFVEFVRADNRGSGRVSAYQVMSLISLPLAVAIFLALPAWPGEPRIEQGIATLLTPAVAGGLLGVGLVVFLYLGTSRMTTATIRFEVRTHG